MCVRYAHNQDLSAAVIGLTAEIDRAAIAAVRKEQLRATLKGLKKKFDDYEKAKKANQEKAVCTFFSKTQFFLCLFLN